MHFPSSLEYTLKFTMSQNDVANSISLMLEQEQTAYACCDYLGEQLSSNSSIISGSSSGSLSGGYGKITPRDRTMIVDWCYEIVDKCQFDRDNVSIAMNLVDRFMNSPDSHDFLYDRVRYQLVALTSLYVVIKLSETTVALSSKFFASLSQGSYTSEVIEDMEMTLLQRLSWRLCPPTSVQVGYKIVALLSTIEDSQHVTVGTSDLLSDEVKFQIENSVRDNYFTSQRPSTTALAAVLNAIEQVNDSNDHAVLLKRLQQIWKGFNFDKATVIIQAKMRLENLMNERVDL